MTLSFRLTARTRSQLQKLARKTGKSQSSLMREALERLVRDQCVDADASRPYEAIAHLIGCVRGLPSDLSSRTGADFRRLLEARRRKA